MLNHESSCSKWRSQTHSGKLRFFSRLVKTARGLEGTVTPQKLNSTAFVPSIFCRHGSVCFPQVAQFYPLYTKSVRPLIHACPHWDKGACLEREGLNMR